MSTQRLFAEDQPGFMFNRHPESTTTYRHGKASMRRPARLTDGRSYPVTTTRKAV